MPQLRSLLGLGPLAWLTLALGVASLLTRLQDLWRGRSDPGGIDKGHLRLEAVTSTNEANLAPQAPQIGQRREAALQEGRHQVHQQVNRDLEGLHPFLGCELNLQAMKELG